MRDIAKHRKHLRRRRKTRNGVTMDYLLDLHREFVRLKYHGVCAFSRFADHACEGPLEVHHIVFQSRSKFLKAHPDNGMLLCQRGHREAECKAGENRVREIVGPDKFDALVEESRMTIIEYLVKNGMSRAEWGLEQAARLKAAISEIVLNETHLNR